MTPRSITLPLFKLVCLITTMMLGLARGQSEESLCKRDLYPRRTGDNGYRVYLVGNPKAYKANEVYTVSIGGTFPNQTFTSFVLNAVPRHAKDEDTALGTLQIIDPKESKSLRLCPHVITQGQSRERREEVEILWTAPSTGSGCVEFRASVGDSGRGWYKDDGALTKVLCEEEEAGAATERAQNDQAPPQTQGECCACGSAKYEMTFEGVWSQESHPRDYPTHKRLLHWSNIVGASHSNKFRIWEYGGYATKGVKEVCEFGYPRAVEEEVKRSSKEARTIIKTTGVWWKDPVGIVQNRSARFTTDRRRHYVSMISMLGPSPDWCVGVSARDLCLPNCTWSEGFVVDLLPWDAGTDSGITYMSPNSKTDPQQRIRPITNTWPNDPRSPFFGTDPIKPLARLRVEKLSPKEERADGDCPDDALVDFDFFGEGESAALDAEKKKEQVGGGKCEVLPWEDWTGCSVTCGVGSRMRRRRYKHPEANEGMCGLPIVERENCIGIENECETSDEDCALTSWSDWSPCSVTCGKGATERRRYYLIGGDESRCNRTVRQVEECTAEQNDCNPIRKSHEICSLPSLRGPCRGQFPKWHYDRRSKKCLSFQYGGCRGNGNRFETKDECLASCAEDDEGTGANNDYCLEPSDPGTCGKRIEMWYFDSGMQKCLPFEYSGCGGNKNRFKTMDGCTEACQSVTATGGTGNRCSLPAVPGPCRDTEERWYFDTQMQKCLPFDYGGCLGNENNFRTMDECTEQCQLSGGGVGLGGSSAPGSRCSLPSERGPCRDNQERWYFDGQMQKCLPFDYSGCGGNTNNFNTMDECTEICQLNAGGTNGEGDDGAAIVLPSARCGLLADAGPCRANTERWYFDLQMQKCLTFDYGGCGGNANNFQTMDECTDSCQPRVLRKESSGTETTTARCFQPSDPGPCSDIEERWHFDIQMEKCLPFHYGGCLGNENNFRTMDECMDSCTSSAAGGVNRCRLPSDEGPCFKNLERWYFDVQMEKCLPFRYGGCAGNGNNFETVEECTESCQARNRVDQSRREDRCSLPSVRGPCGEDQERWYFDIQMQKCLPFEYGGCLGNENNFQTMDECMESCQLSGGDGTTPGLDSVPGSRCSHQSERGPCSDNQERWYFDTQMEKCLPFDYSGCGGNDNNFRTMEECADLCPGGNVGGEALRSGSSLRCAQPSEPGPCGNYEERWYFDTQMEKCLPFDYGGCQGNENNFQTMDECSEACRGQGPGDATAFPATPATEGNGGRYKRFCTFTRDRGLCRGNLERWYFDIHVLRCLPFHYGGCGGNANNFQTEGECMETCQDSHEDPNQLSGGRRSSSSSSSSPFSSSSSSTSSAFASRSGTNSDNDNVQRILFQPQISHNNIHASDYLNDLSRCNLAPDPGPCKATVQRWYFDSRSDKCLPFEYGGCSGNANNFQDMYTCMGACHLLGQRSRSSGTIEGDHGDRCELPPETGPCRSNLERWYFDKQSRNCLRFQYGGCGGNTNNFHDHRACAEACRTGTDGEDSTPSTDSDSGENSNRSGGRCSQPFDVGPCRRRVEKWYYDPRMEKCLPFQYGGCGGNDNRFEDMYACIDECLLSVTPTEPPTNHTDDRCRLPPDMGPCKARIERWYYNSKLRSCLTFLYGGCGGNGNSFQSHSACSDACRKTSTAYSHAERPPTSFATESRTVDCRMSSWSDWSACSATCGSGHRTKSREILVHPTAGGKQCSKMVARRQKCKLPACANECQYGQWSSWSSCTKSCGYGSYQQRTQRPISSSPPSSSSSSSSSSSHLRSSSSSSSSGGNLKCAERVQRTLCELPKCPH